jgi:hypothetical protein
MNHTVHEKQKLRSRVRRIRGQVEAIERALEGELSWSQVMYRPGHLGAIVSVVASAPDQGFNSFRS